MLRVNPHIHFFNLLILYSVLYCLIQEVYVYRLLLRILLVRWQIGRSLTDMTYFKEKYLINMPHEHVYTTDLLLKRTMIINIVVDVATNSL